MVGRHRAAAGKITRVQPGKGASKRDVGYTQRAMLNRTLRTGYEAHPTRATQFSAGVHSSAAGQRDVRIRSEFRWPKSGMATWKPVSSTVMPSGYVIAQLRKKKGSR